MTTNGGKKSTVPAIDHENGTRHLVRRAERQHQSAGWRKAVQEIEVAFGLNTDHKA